MQFHRDAAVDERPERAAGSQLWKLSVVAGQDELSVDSEYVPDQLGDLVRRHHAGLVDDEHATLRKRAASVASGARRRDGSACRDGAAGGRRDPEHDDVRAAR